MFVNNSKYTNYLGKVKILLQIFLNFIGASRAPEGGELSRSWHWRI